MVARGLPIMNRNANHARRAPRIALRRWCTFGCIIAGSLAAYLGSARKAGFRPRHKLAENLHVRLPSMVANIIRFVLQNLPALMFIVAFVFAAVRRRHGAVAERLLSWILLLPIGITGLWAGTFHVCFPSTAATPT